MIHPNGVVQVGTPSRGYNADDLEKRRIELVAVDMAKADPEIRRMHIDFLKQEKRINAARPGVKDYWAKFVGERNVTDALAMLSREADAEIQREAYEAQMAAAKRPEPSSKK